MIKQTKVKSNGSFSIINEPFNKKQHPNQQGNLEHKETGLIGNKLYKKLGSDKPLTQK